MKITSKILLIILFLTNLTLEFPLSEIEFPCDKKITHLFDNIYLGDIRAALSKKTLELYNIKYIINVGTGKLNYEGIQFLELGIELKKDAKLFPNLDKGYDYIKAIQKNITEKINNLNKTISANITSSVTDNNLNKTIDANITSNVTSNITRNNTINESILIYCFDGKSRGPALLIYYLMKDKNISAIRAFSYIRGKRKGVLPMTGFAKQLYEKQSELKIENTNKKSKTQKEEKHPAKKESKTIQKKEKGKVVKVKSKSEKNAKNKKQNIKKQNNKKQINKKMNKIKSKNDKLKDKKKKIDAKKVNTKEDKSNQKEHSKIDINNIKIKQTIDVTQEKKQEIKQEKKQDKKHKKDDL